MNWKVLIAGLVLVLGLVAVLASGFGKDPQHIPSPLLGKPAPVFELPVLDGGGSTLTLSELRGRPVVVNFWATWCKTCEIEHPLLSRLAKAYEGRVQFVGIAYLDSDDKIRAWLDRFGGRHFPCLIDVGTSAAVAYGVGRLPETYLVDQEGVIRQKYFGAINNTSFVADLEALL